MSSAFPDDGFIPELLFRSVSGSKIRLNDKSTLSSDLTTRNVLKFILRKDKSLNINVSLFLLCTTLFLWKVFDSLVPFTISAFALVAQCCSFICATDKDTLLVVESVGIYIEGKRLLYGLKYCEFLPWDTVIDIFINEVITGQKVLYYLTIIIKESLSEANTIRLVPLFQDLKPE